MEIRKLEVEEIDTVIDLVNRVFYETVAMEETKEGIKSFGLINTKEFYNSPDILTYLAVDDQKVIGMVSLKEENHISLLFVEPRYHRQGIASALINRVLLTTTQTITVHSSLYGYKFYFAIGFHSTNIIQEDDGMTYIPMVKRRNV